MASGWSSDVIHRLTIHVMVQRLVRVEADGQEVYIGDDLAVVERWKSYYRDAIPYAEIARLERGMAS